MVELPGHVKRLIQMSLEEDIGSGDVTTEALIDQREGKARITAKEECVVCGLGVAEAVFTSLDPAIEFVHQVEEGTTVERDSCIARIRGPLATVLKGERTALNFLQRMCGVASLSRRFALKGAGRVTVLDSRKTIPGWRWLDKLAVRTGGCTNHRMGLYDGILIKDNHITASGGIPAAVKKTREKIPHGMPVEVEVKTMGGLREAVEAGADIIMLDNFESRQIDEAVRVAGDKAILEVSGGINLENMEDYIRAGAVKFISTGYMTHSARAVDISMEIT